MKARNLASPQPVLRVRASARDAAAVLARHDVRSVLVVDDQGSLVGILSDSELLRGLLPSYVDQSSTLAHVLEEGAAEVLYRRLEGRSIEDLMPRDRDVAPLVRGDDTLVEVASVMVRARASAVGVIDDDRLIGGITIDDLLSHLLSLR
jgi:CBS domain-containing protein